ncbi:MAG: Fpg/Nei family DNA glycosylase, partial [Candidatus Hodarchaeales archaeon]
FTVFESKKLLNISRFNKFLVWEFSIDPVILNHLGMTGKWVILNSIADIQEQCTHPKVIIEITDSKILVFDDTRNFGQFRLFPSLEEIKQYRPIKTLGMDGLGEKFSVDIFLDKISEKRFHSRIVGELLMDPRLVSGIGNIYKAEILFEAKIHPERSVSSLSLEEKTVLGQSIPKILLHALNDKGSSFDARYILPSGENGQAQRWHKVYQRKGQQCLICESAIEKLIQKNRSTYFCTNCQK